MTKPTLGFNNDNLNAVIAELDPNKISEKIEKFFSSVKLLHFSHHNQYQFSDIFNHSHNRVFSFYCCFFC